MPKYIIAYIGGKKPETPEEGAKGMEKWKAWVSDLGDAIVNPGTPLTSSKTVSSSSVSDTDPGNRLSGYSVVTADNLDAALEMAKSCPFLEMGDLQVAEMMEMP
jgi:hypothetical protein